MRPAPTRCSGPRPDRQPRIPESYGTSIRATFILQIVPDRIAGVQFQRRPITVAPHERTLRQEEIDVGSPASSLALECILGLARRLGSSVRDSFVPLANAAP
jgi:hypothetical protein